VTDKLALPELDALAPAADAPDVGPAQLFVATLLPGASQRTAVEAMQRLLRLWQIDAPWQTFAWHQLTARETTYARLALMRDYAPITARTTLSMLRGVLRQAFRVGLMTAETYQRAILLPPVRLESAPAGRMLTDAEIERLATYTRGQPSPQGPLLTAIFAAGLGAGLRREELVALSASALANDRAHLLVRGKGGRERVQALPPWAGEAIAAWLTVRRGLGLTCDAMFTPISPQGTARDEGFTVLGMWRVISATGQAAGCEHFTPHDLRRTFCSKMLDRADLSSTQKLMGHKSATTTVRYDRRDAKRAEAAVATLEACGFAAPPEGFARKGAPLDLAWARSQIAELRARKVDDAKIARALSKAGVTGPAGALSQADVELLGGKAV